MKNRFEFQISGEDGNAFSIMGRFRREAQKNGWTAEEIKEVMDKAMNGDYDNLLVTFMEVTDAQ